jgi:hypothetical protein
MRVVHDITGTYGRRESMTRSRYGFLAGIAGAALASWWLTKLRMELRANRRSLAERGEVIFSNTPAAD